MATRAEIRAKLQEAQSKSTGRSTGGGDNAIYPHWNMQEGKEAVIRLLPDGNPNNTFFWVERAMSNCHSLASKVKLIHVQYRYRFPVWKCTMMAQHVRSSQKFVGGSKTRVLKKWVANIGRSVVTFSKGL